MREAFFWVQKAALHNFYSALVDTQLENVAAGKENQCLKFSKKALRNNKHQNWFELKQGTRDIRAYKPYLCQVVARTRRF